MPTVKHEDIPDSVIEAIAERAAAKALEKVYAEVGKSILRRTAWVVGIAAISLVVWLKSKGVL